jgi:hypothetical protein
MLSGQRSLDEPPDARLHRYEAGALVARLLFESGNRLAVFLDVQFAPGDHLRSHIERFPALVGDVDGFERVPKRKRLAFPLQLIFQLFRHRLYIRHWLIR